jgi:predicted nucleic acid-binding Zn ribbon protein
MPWKPLPRTDSDPPVRLDRPLGRVLRHLGVPSASVLPSLEQTWADVVGPALAQHSSPVTLKHGRLLVRVDDPAWASQLRWMEQQVLARLRQEPGYEQAAGLDVRIGPGPSDLH